ncbi:MAG: hypothetical protein AAGD33_17860 [Actinomycetota bacterium]
MASDTDPRPEFVAALREWFVDEVGRPASEGSGLERELTVDTALVRDGRTDVRSERERRRWVLFANAAAVIGVVVGLGWLATRGSEPVTNPPAESLPTPVVDPVAVATGVCAQFRVGAAELALGASADEVERAASNVRTRLVRAQELLDDAVTGGDLDEARRLAGEGIGAADRLLAVADADRQSIDSAVGSLDLIIVAWSRELADLDGDQCPDLPTLREVF